MKIVNKFVRILNDFAKEVEKAILKGKFKHAAQDGHTDTIIVSGVRVAVWTASGVDIVRPYSVETKWQHYHFPDTAAFVHKEAVYEAIIQKRGTSDFGCEEHH